MKTKTLYLPIEKKWFNLILSGEKKEEYRDFKPYYARRFYDKNCIKIVDNEIALEIIQFEHVILKNGYDKNAPEIIIECLGIKLGIGKKIWGANDKKCFIISLGKIVSTLNIKSNEKAK